MLRESRRLAVLAVLIMIPSLSPGGAVAAPMLSSRDSVNHTSALPTGDVPVTHRTVPWTMRHATVRIVRGDGRRADTVKVHGRTSSPVGPRQLRALLDRGAVVTVSQRQDTPSAGQFKRLISVPLVACVRAQSRAKVVTCSGRGGSTLHLTVPAQGASRLRVTLTKQRLGHIRLTHQPLRAEIAITNVVWAAAPRTCGADRSSRKTTVECSGHNIARLAMTWPQGPISRTLLRTILRPTPHRRDRGSGDGCGSTYSATGEGLTIASGFLSMIPVAGSVLGPVAMEGGLYFGAMGDQAGDACLTAEFALINQQLADQQAEIEGLQNDFELSENQFYQGELSSAADTTTVAASIYLESLQNMSPMEGALGLFGQFMEQSGFWTLGLQPAAGSSVEASASDPLTFQGAMSTASNSSSFVLNLNDLAGSFVNVEACPNGGCGTAVESSPTSALLTMWNQKAVTLLKAWQANRDAGGPGGTNVVPLYDEYNNSIIADYTQSLNSLQQAYQMEYLVNQMNYFHGSDVCADSTALCEQIETLGAVPGTYYNYNSQPASTTAAQQAAAYNAAQRGLTMTYAARVNILYINALNYIASDIPISPQAYPSTPISVTIKGRTVVDPNPISYSSQVGAALPAVPFGPAQTPMGQLPGVLQPLPMAQTTTLTASQGSWMSQAVLYQFAGLRDVNICATTLWTLNQTTGMTETPQEALSAPGACPAVFILNGEPLNEGFYDGDRLQPYTNVTSSTTPSISLTGPMQVNLRLCSATEPSLTWYTPKATAAGNAAGLVTGMWYLACGNWATIGPDSCFPGAHCPIGWSDVAAAPFSFVASQYYQTPGSYPSNPPGEDPVSSSVNVNTIPYNGQNWQAAVQFVGFNGYGGPVTACYTGGQTACDTTSESAYFSSVTSDASSWKFVNWGLEVLSKTRSGGSGFIIPVQMAYYRQSSPMTMTFQPRQDAQMEIDGFECTGATCTVADGGTWTFQLAPAGTQSYEDGWTLLSFISGS